MVADSNQAVARFTHLLEVAGLIKGAHALVQFCAAASIYLMSGVNLQYITESIFQRELLEDPHDTAVQFFLERTQHVTAAGIDFAILYLFLSGVINTALCIAIFSGRMTGYLGALTVLACLTMYEIYIVNHTHSILMLAIIVYDIVLLFLLYRALRSHHGVQGET